MTSKDYKSGKLIILSKPFDTRAKILNLIYFIVFTLSGLIFFEEALTTRLATTGLYIFMIIVIGVYLLAGYRFVNKALQAEKLMISRTDLTIEKTGFFTHSKKSFGVDHILNLRYLKLPETSKHPLAGETFDYLGFQTEQQVINEMHGDNKIAFDYENKTITFGENLYSWDFDEIARLICEVTGDFKFQAKTTQVLE